MTSNDLLQSDGWERFQQALGRKTERVDSVLCIRMPLPFGLSYLYSPRISLPRHCEEPARGGRRGNLTPSVQRLAQENGAVFWRAECSEEPVTRHSSLVTPRVLRRAVEPEWTWRTSLEGSDDDRMAAMHEKHRYNVRLAERRGVTVRVSAPPPTPPQHEGEGQPRPPTSYRGGVGGGAMPEDFEMFWSLLQDTARRQGIATHPRSYYETMLRELPQTALYLTEHEGIPTAAAIIAYHGDTATYLHGGSSYEHRSLMAPHLLHWQAMRDAKAAGMRWYDFGGVIPVNAECRMQNAELHWSGMTRFKIGFGGEAVHHPQPMDLVLRPGWYRMLAWLARLRS